MFRRLLIIVALGGIALTTAGCEFLFPGLQPPMVDPLGSGDPFPSDFPTGSDYPQPSPIATYTKGEATLAIDGRAPLTLDHLSAGPHVIADYGTQATWSADGWYLSLTIYDDLGGGAEPPAIALDRITGGQHWTIFEGLDGCVVKVTRSGVAGVAGTASCTQLRWSDMMAPPPFDDSVPYIAGQAPFDLKATFSARP